MHRVEKKQDPTIEEIKKEVDDYVNERIIDLQAHTNFIIGMSRGGLIPAAMIATKLDKPLIAAYIDREDNIYLDKKDWIVNKNVLIVDDIIRSGKTLHLLNRYLYKETRVYMSFFFTLYNVNHLRKEEYAYLIVDTIRELEADIDLPWDYSRIDDNNA